MQRVVLAFATRCIMQNDGLREVSAGGKAPFLAVYQASASDVLQAKAGVLLAIHNLIAKSIADVQKKISTFAPQTMKNTSDEHGIRSIPFAAH